MSKIMWAALTLEQRDRLVAEKVMNNLPGPCTGVWHESSPDSGEWDFLCLKCGAAITEEEYENRNALHDPLPVPRYTQSMDAAWQIVEKLDCKATVHRYTNGNGAQVLYSCFLSNSSWNSIASSYILPEAICIAALLSAGVEVDRTEESDG